jgi:hypothetical protein
MLLSFRIEKPFSKSDIKEKDDKEPKEKVPNAISQCGLVVKHESPVKTIKAEPQEVAAPKVTIKVVKTQIQKPKKQSNSQKQSLLEPFEKLSGQKRTYMSQFGVHNTLNETDLTNFKVAEFTSPDDLYIPSSKQVLQVEQSETLAETVPEQINSKVEKEQELTTQSKRV